MRSARDSRCSNRDLWTAFPSASGPTGAALRGGLRMGIAVADDRPRVAATVEAGSPAAEAEAVRSGNVKTGSEFGGMMKLDRFRPLHGWRAFIGEVGVIVLGVLIALGAQQAVERWQDASDVRAFRTTIDHEIGLNLFIYQIRMQGSACEQKRIADLLEWVEASRDGQILPPIQPGLPDTLTPYRSAWDNRNAQVFDNLAAKTAQKYAEFYDELKNNTELMQKDTDAWVTLRRYAIPGPVTLDDRREMYRQLRVLRSINRALGGNIPISLKIANDLQIKPIVPDNVDQAFLDDVKKCRPIFVPKAH